MCLSVKFYNPYLGSGGTLNYTLSGFVGYIVDLKKALAGVISSTIR